MVQQMLQNITRDPQMSQQMMQSPEMGDRAGQPDGMLEHPEAGRMGGPGGRGGSAMSGMDPAMMQGMLQSPMVQQMLQNIARDPQMSQQMMQRPGMGDRAGQPDGMLEHPEAGSMGGLGGRGGSAMPGMDPAMMQRMLQSPMVQQMLQNIAQDPQMSQQMMQSPGMGDRAGQPDGMLEHPEAGSMGRLGGQGGSAMSGMHPATMQGMLQ